MFHNINFVSNRASGGVLFGVFKMERTGFFREFNDVTHHFTTNSIGFLLFNLFRPASSVGAFIYEYFGISLAFSFEGILLGSLIFCTPFMLTPIMNGFRSIPKNLIESTYLLNKSRINALWYVFIPYIKKGILNGVLLTFAHTIGEFGLVLMIGGKMKETNVASVAIYDQMNAMNYESVHIYALILLLVSFVLIVCLNIFTRNSRSRVA